MQGEHKNIEDYKVFENNGLVLFFDDGSHTYLDPQLIGTIINEILCWPEVHEEIPDEELPFPDEPFFTEGE